jgi:outer membrane lipoprotein
MTPHVFRPALLSALALVLGACASAPAPLQGQYSAISPSEAAARGATGERVRWGGQVVAIHNAANESCFEVVGKPVGVDGRPLVRDSSAGRFIACRAGFYDPAVFTAGREVTISGTVAAFETRKIDQYDYRYPRVAAEVVYLWPVRRDVDVIVERPWFVW